MFKLHDAAYLQDLTNWTPDPDVSDYHRCVMGEVEWHGQHIYLDFFYGFDGGDNDLYSIEDGKFTWTEDPGKHEREHKLKDFGVEARWENIWGDDEHMMLYSWGGVGGKAPATTVAHAMQKLEELIPQAHAWLSALVGFK